MGIQDAWPVLKQTVSEWMEDEVPLLAAALAYYTAFAMAPVLIVVIAVAGLAFDSAHVRAEVLHQMRDLLGAGGADLVRGMLEEAGRPDRSVLAMVAGVAAILIASSGLFATLNTALDKVWEVEPPKGRGVLGVIKDRFLSFTMVLGIGFLLLVSLVLSAAVAAFGKYADRHLPAAPVLLQAAYFVLGFALTTAMFAMIFKVLPDVKLRWRDVWLGAAVTAALFTVGRWLIGLYLGRGTVASAYGAAGSLAIVLVWVYYSSQVLLLGAEFTQVYTRRRGTVVEPQGKATLRSDAHKATRRRELPPPDDGPPSPPPASAATAPRGERR
jgi:membrane protein